MAAGALLLLGRFHPMAGVRRLRRRSTSLQPFLAAFSRPRDRQWSLALLVAMRKSHALNAPAAAEPGRTGRGGPARSARSAGAVPRPTCRPRRAAAGSASAAWYLLAERLARGRIAIAQPGGQHFVRRHGHLNDRRRWVAQAQSHTGTRRPFTLRTSGQTFYCLREQGSRAGSCNPGNFACSQSTPFRPPGVLRFVDADPRCRRHLS